MTGLLLALLAASCPSAPEPGAPPASLAAGARAVAEALARDGPGPPAAVAAEAASLASAASDPATPPGALRDLAARFRARLEHHCRLAALAPGPRASAADRARLAEILSRPEFRARRGDAFALGRWLARLRDRILELLGGEEAGRYATGGRNLFFATLAVAAALALRASLRRRAAARRRLPEPSAVEPAARPDPEAAEARAAAALRGGDGREAVRQALLVLLASLERAGRLPASRALTNREVSDRLAASAAHPELARGFAELARVFDRVVYGGGAPAAGEAEACLAHARALRRAAEEERA